MKNQWDKFSNNDKVCFILRNGPFLVFEQQKWAILVIFRGSMELSLVPKWPTLLPIEIKSRNFGDTNVKILIQKILKKNISEDLKVNRIRYKVRVASNEESSTCYLLLSAQERIQISGRTKGGSSAVPVTHQSSPWPSQKPSHIGLQGCQTYRTLCL